MIERKEKPCKGTGQAKGYGCGKLTKYRTYGLGKSCCYAEWLYTSDAGKVKISKSILKVSAPRLEMEKQSMERKQKNTLSGIQNSLKTVFHEYVRLRDKGKPCISCGEPWHNDFHAGHFFKAELHSSVRFEEFNVHGQCAGCNIYKEGNLSQYVINLPERIGLINYNHLVMNAEWEKQNGFKWNRETLKGLQGYYRKKLNELKKQG
jgi:hypothetical protein